ncbi:hypothetical protein HKBW3S47_01808, partial [Candidatus Hakubella thermalkaliphila]
RVLIEMDGEEKVQLRKVKREL